ncbi:2-hydroxy-3-oxopropionate reductase [Cocleimonas flava]|uniref:3-hydroxyisobutyrate dehydrogenase-like beta-hydroxyacid dehydrogenase n=1 Tax=Cocleimonas flava TaxID=634765 RepID=A0A4R1EYX8_9GAMM|nr:NAD(P)-binding domain-containing protein [Cocleimonas flava]TCJ87106.1 3-hydroxyisobutyrate dehydrogenase-like beta-hydroxyacid dehydrogenase [Cocleimonas flava]
MSTNTSSNTNNLSDYKIGFIGLGLMGKPMCLNLQKAGAELIVHNRSQQVVHELSQQSNITAAKSSADVASQTNIIILMLSDTNALETVIFGDNGLFDSLQKGSLVIDMGTSAVTKTRAFAEKLKTIGIDYIDAPVSGGELGAINASLVIMAGGSDVSIEKAKPIFDVLGSSLVHIGDVGTGQITKAANQVIVGLNIGAVAEALTLAKQAGADVAKVREALMGGFAASRVLELHGQRMIDETFKPGGKITTQHKDLTQALELAAEYDQSLPATKLNRSLYQNLINDGKGELDHSALFLAYKQSRLLQNDD